MGDGVGVPTRTVMILTAVPDKSFHNFSISTM